MHAGAQSRYHGRTDMPSPIRAVVADDFPAVRHGVVTVIASSPDLEVVGEAGSAEEAIAVIAKEQPDVAVLDLGMPGVRGLELLRELRARHPKLGMLVFSMHREEDVALACLKAGATGFLNKSVPVEELRRAVRTVSEGRRYLSDALTETLVEGMPLPIVAPPHTALSQRELDVLCRLARSQRVTEIASDLGISAKTVHTYRTRILQKLGVRTNVDLVLYAIEHRLLGWPPHEEGRARTRLDISG